MHPVFNALNFIRTLIKKKLMWRLYYSGAKITGSTVLMHPVFNALLEVAVFYLKVLHTNTTRAYSLTHGHILLYSLTLCLIKFSIGLDDILGTIGEPFTVIVAACLQAIM